MKLYLGLDGGGTKTASVILDENGGELGRGLGGPCNIATCDDEQLTSSISEALSSALSSAGLEQEQCFAGVCAGVAGYTAKRRRAEFTCLLPKLIRADRHLVEPDFKIAYWGATEGEPGIIVSAGTGAVVFGRNRQGEECRMDGRGFLFGDHGSAFDLGRRFLDSILHAFDHPLPNGTVRLDALSRKVMGEIGASDADDIVEWTYRDFSPARIASAAAIICREAAQGDAEAIFLVQGQGAALRRTFDEVASRLRMWDDAPVYLLGSLWSVGEPILQTFTRSGSRSPEAPPPLKTLEPRHDAAFGAALLAMRTD